MDKIIGHDIIINGIIKKREKNSFSHATLIVGEDGIGKSVVAKYLAGTILNTNIIDNYPDIFQYRPSKATFGIDEVRDIITEVNRKPFKGDSKVIILYNCDKMTPQAQNALLKTVEEPPAGVYIILLSLSLESILETIKSRCQVYKLTPLSKKDMLQYIEYNNIVLDDNKKQVALAYSMGIPGKIDKFLNDKKLIELRDIVLDIFNSIVNRDSEFVLKYQEVLKSYKDEKYDFLDIFLLYLRDMMIAKELSGTNEFVNYDKAKEILKITNNISYTRLSNITQYIEEARTNFDTNANYLMAINTLLIGLLEV